MPEFVRLLDDGFIEVTETFDFGTEVTDGNPDVLDGNSWRITDQGFLVANPRVARTGIQIYRGSELGVSDKEVVRVYRPPEEVFHKDAMASFAHRTITDDHPSEFVNADNWAKLTKGHSADQVTRDGETVRVPIVIMDGNAVQKVRGGKRQLSAGYRSKIRWGDGKVPGTEEVYDAMQTEIRANHIALCKVARGGPLLSIGDDEEDDDHKPQPPTEDYGVNDMAGEANAIRLRTIRVDGIECQVADATASVVERTIEKLVKDLADANAKVTALGTEHAAAITKLTNDHNTAMATAKAENAALTKRVTDAETAAKPEALQALADARADIIDRAGAVLGDRLVVDAKSNTDIMRQVVDAAMGTDAKDYKDAEVQAAFTVLTKDHKPGTTQRTQTRSVGGGLPVRDAGRQLGRPGFVPNNEDTRAEAYINRAKGMSDAWKGPQPAAAAK